MTLPGVVAERLDPHIIAGLASGLRDGAVVITGTNGKTTTAKMLGDALAGSGRRVVSNDSGSNLRQGIASALVRSAHVLGSSIDGDVAVLEVDEATMPRIAADIGPRVVCVTNLSRDQLDRYGDLETIGTLLAEALASVPEAHAVLNADDPPVASLARHAGGGATFFGIDDSRCARPAARRGLDPARCPSCATPLLFAHTYYGHLGDWLCPKCGHSRPMLDVAARDVRLDAHSARFDLVTGERTVRVSLPFAGLHNVYNALAAAACGLRVGLHLNEIASALERTSPPFGRTEELAVEGGRVTLALVKNPVGAEQALVSVLAEPGPKAVAIALNDNLADGTDVSWIWDIDFEAFDLTGCSTLLCGSRAEDIAVRLKYAGVADHELSVCRDPVEAVAELAARARAGVPAHMLATYTAMLEIRGAFAHKDDPFARLGRTLRNVS
jgi:lipid II isoglutaminyl synthase (glutamine-hydrolysing)